MVSRADGPNPRRPGSPVRGRSRPADTRCVHGRGRDQNSSLPAVKSSRVESLRAILRAKGHSREAANMMSRCLRESSQQVYESHWSRFVAFCRTKKVTGQGFPAGTSGATQNHAQVGSSSGFIIINETAVYISKWGWWGILGWRHSPKMADAQMFVPVSIGFSKTALIPARLAPGRCVFARGSTQRQLVVSLPLEPGFLAKNQLPTQAPEWITVPGIAHLNPTEPERMLCPVRQLKLYIRDSERIRGGRQRMFIHWNRSIRDIMSSHISRWIVETVKETYTLIVSMTVWQLMRSEHCQLHGRITVRWLYLTSCQRLFGGLLEFSRTRTCATWPVLLRACRHWVQWWSHNTSWIQDIFTHLHSLHDLYAATAMTFLMKNTWLLAGIFMYGTE